MRAQLLKIGFAALAMLSVCPGLLHAQSLEDKIGSALQAKKPLSRSLSAASDQKAAAEKIIVDRLRTRAIGVEASPVPTVDERAQIAEIARDKPAIDLEILFEYNSDDVSAKAAPVLLALGNALSQQDLKGAIFFINGHTDVAGGADYIGSATCRYSPSFRRAIAS